MITITLADVVDMARWLIIIGILAGSTYKHTLLDVRRNISWQRFLKQVAAGTAAGVLVIGTIAAEAFGYAQSGWLIAVLRGVQYAGNVAFNVLLMASWMQGLYTCFPRILIGAVSAAVWIVVPYTGIVTSLDVAGLLTVAVFAVLYKKRRKK